jgi:anti-anti-sigma factor
MNMHSGKVLYASHEGIAVLRFVGDIRYTLTPSVERFIEQLFTKAMPKGLVIDLTETVSIDSTSLGLMARIANRLRNCRAQRVTLVSDREDINEMLSAMGFRKVFNIVHDSESPSKPTQELPVAEPDRQTLSRIVLEAHRTLMAMNRGNEQRFRDVVTALEKERETDSSAPSPGDKGPESFD